MVTKYPLLGPAVAMTLGILIARWAPPVWQIAFLATGVLGLLAATFDKHRAILILGFWLFIGASLFSFRYEVHQPTDLRLVLNGEPQLMRIAGVLRQDPERRVLERDSETRYRTTARVI